MRAAQRSGPWQRELYPQDMVNPPEYDYCVNCRGPHSENKVHNLSWQPYTVEQRLGGLHKLRTRFQEAHERGSLPVKLHGSLQNKVEWIQETVEGGTLTPERMTQEDYNTILPLLFEGAREGHEPYRFLAVEAASAMLAAGRGKSTAVVPSLIAPIRLALSTFEPSLVAGMLQLIQRLIKSSPRVGAALVPHFQKLTPVMSAWQHRQQAVQLPPAGCVPSTGGFAGSGGRPGACNTHCYVCGVHVGKEEKAAKDMRKALQARRDNAHLQAEPLPKPAISRLAMGRTGRRYVMAELVGETLECMVNFGGPAALAAMKRCVPTYDMQLA
ncbi:hypothetical protein WJX72_005340 [[Myrmecia] bisecta]|uniref:Uncharacterized protein n=1 Tax=[Myrmecia] bisecta TaxID=41462 RepID=A0AAW1Q4P6_9CHLO